ncbi:MAG: STAS domain-containing protein [candidate division Zixibacteria bacterium]|nr:STAS domain-containing protein [candidate division Zixibacteria bacterium]MCI0595302.1 STAS domain-containing protein [candidate division Zixibacteria bacterium]
MNFKTGEKEGIVVVTPKGKILDGPDTNRLREKIEEFVRIGARRMVIDLGEVPHMDSSGIRILVAALKGLHKEGGELRLARITDKVEDLIAITQLTEKFKTYPSVAEAVRSFPSVN